MIEETGVVVELDGDHAWVESERRSSCGSCSAKGCGTGALSKILGAKKQRMRVQNPINAEVGDAVTLGIEEGALLAGSVMVYIVPLILMLAGGLLGEALAPQWEVSAESASLIFGLLGLVAGFFWLRAFNRRASSNPRYTAVILKKLTPGHEIKAISLNL